MRAALTLAFLLSAQPAFAACHHYSKWLYPWPQSCRSAPVRVHHAKLEQTPPAPAPDIDPILIPPGWDEDEERREAIETLKTELQTGGK